MNRCREEKRSCNTWDRGVCPSPCEEVDCPAFSQCIDTSTDEVNKGAIHKGCLHGGRGRGWLVQKQIFIVREVACI